MLTYKRKLILTVAQERRIASWIGACRVVYNLGLEISIDAYRKDIKRPSAYDLQKQITDLRKDFKWINDVPANTLADATARLQNAYLKFFNTCHSGGGLPKFANKRKFNSISFRQCIVVSADRIRIPNIGWLKMHNDASITGIPKRATIIKEPTGYFVCITCDEKRNIQNQDENQVCGIDMGITQFYVNSNGELIENPRHFQKHERKLRIENRSLARKKKGSNGWKKQAKRLGRLHHTIGNVRRDFIHKESTKLAKRFHTVYVEDLNIRGMAKNKNLSKHILDCGWGMFRTMLEYKTNVVRVDPKFTSQTCNECGKKDSKSRINQSEFSCTNCGHVSNADHNAAKNILSKGIALNRKRSEVSQALVLESKNKDVSDG